MDFLADITNTLPETILVGFGLIGLLLGAIGGDRISGLLRLAAAIALAVASAVAFMQFSRGEAICSLRQRRPGAGWPLQGDAVHAVRQVGDVCAGGVRAVHVGRRAEIVSDGALRVSAAGDVRFVWRGHDAVGQRPDDALCRHRDAEPVLLRAGRLPARQHQVGGSGPEVFCARRAGVGPAAVRFGAGLRLLGRHGLCGDRCGAVVGWSGVSAWCS